MAENELSSQSGESDYDQKRKKKASAPSPNSGASASTTTEAPTNQGRKKRKSRSKRELGDVDFNFTRPYNSDNPQNGEDVWEEESNKTTDAKIEEEFRDFYSRMSRRQRIRIGHQLETFLVSSSFAGRNVKLKNYRTSQSVKYGNCYTLQYRRFKSTKSGPMYGLELILFLETEEYVRGWTNGNGAHLAIHDIDTIPLMQKDGMAIAGGTETFIGLKRINIERLGLPYGNCNDGTLFNTKFNMTYTRQMCQKYCTVKFVVDNCGCYDHRSEEVNINFKLTEEYDPCSSSGEIECVLKLKTDHTFRSNTCECYSPCSEVKFEKSTSSRQWPSVEYGAVLKEAVCENSSPRTCKNLKQYDDYLLAQNFVKLNIYYEDLNYENITETPDYAEAQFLSDIGGTLGLWIGLSVLSIFEVGQFVVQLISVFCACSKRTPEPRDQHVRSNKTVPEGLYSKPEPSYDDYPKYRC